MILFVVAFRVYMKVCMFNGVSLFIIRYDRFVMICSCALDIVADMEFKNRKYASHQTQRVNMQYTMHRQLTHVSSKSLSGPELLGAITHLDPWH